jgi:hypothetical protein
MGEKVKVGELLKFDPISNLHWVIGYVEIYI